MQVLLLLLLGIVLWAVYRPGLFGPYVFDDFQNITRNPSIAIDSLSLSEILEAAFSKSEGGLGRPIAMASFALNYFFNGKALEPFAFKLTNLLIHMANVLIVYLLLRLLFQSANMAFADPSTRINQRRAVLLAIFAAALWGLHPLQLTSVLYTVQRMTSLSAFFVLFGALLFVIGRRDFSRRPIRAMVMMTGGLGGGAFLGLLCKENAVLLPLLAATIELGLFSRGELVRASRRKLLIFYLCFLGIPALMALGYILANPDFILQTYSTRDYGVTERVLTQSRFLFFYLSLIIFPLIFRFGLYHDDFALSTGLLDPPSTLVALIAWTVIVWALVKGLRRRAIWAFGLAWFLAGHALESGIVGLEIIHEHRNYVPSVGICMAGAYYFSRLFDKLRLPARGPLICGLSLLLVFSFVTHTRALIWSSRSQLFESMVQHHPNSYRAISGLATSMVEQGRDVRPVYNALRDASLANVSAAHPLIEMKQILHALIPAVENSEDGVPESSGDHTSSVTWTSDLVIDREYLLELDKALTPEISRRLAAGTFHIETIYALWKAQSCVTGDDKNCASLSDEVLGWHLAVLAELPPRDRRRGILELSSAKIYAAAGDLDGALRYTDRAIETMSGYPRFRAQKAMLLIKLGAIEQAEKIADGIEQEMDWRRIYAGDVEVLRREIENAKAKQEQASVRPLSGETPRTSSF